MTQPGGNEPLKKITLLDSAGTSYDLILAGGDSSINETHLAPNPITPGGAGKYGDFDPSFGFLEQRDWSRGFGLDNFSDDTSRYYSSEHMWTATPGQILPQLKWRWAKGFVSQDYNEFDDLDTPDTTTDNSVYYSTSFTASATYSAKYVYFWIAGSTSVANTYAKIYSDSGGVPSVVQGTSDAITEASYEDNEYRLIKFTFATPVSLTAATTYHVVFYATGSGGAGGEFVPLCESNLTGGLFSTDDFATSSSNGTLWYRIMPEYAAQSIRVFTYLKALTMAVTIPDDGSASKLYINGDAGKATSGTASTITDSNEGLRGSWTTDQWVGAKVWIYKGVGAGQVRSITANNTTGQITVSPDFDITPTTTSQFSICDTDDWYELSTTGLSTVTDVTFYGETIFFAQGSGSSGANIRKARYNSGGSPPAMQYADDGSNKCDVIYAAHGHVWAGANDTGTAYKAPIQSWGTAHTFVTLSPVTDSAFNFSSITHYDGKVWIFKQKTVWFVDPETRKLQNYPVAIGFLPSDTNCRAVCRFEEYLFFNWAYALERISGKTVDHLDPNAGAGMPDAYRGPVSAMVAHPAGVFFSVDAGTSGNSTVNIFDGLGFHQALYMPIAGRRIRGLHWQSIPDSQPILWVSSGDTLLYQKYPQNHTNPLKDSNCVFMHTGKLTTATIDMNSKGLKKLFRDVSIVAKDFGTGGHVNIFYQADSDIGSSTWTFIGFVSSSTEIDITDAGFAGANSLGNVRELRLKILITLASGATPPNIQAYTIKAFGRTPVRKQWSIAIDVSKTAETLGSGDPATLMSWLDTKAGNAEVVLITSEHPRLHNKTAIIIPRSLRTIWINSPDASFSGTAYLELREA